MNRILMLSVGLTMSMLAGCKREQRVFDPGSAGAQLANGVALNEVHPGVGRPPHQTRRNTKRAPTQSRRESDCIRPTTVWVATGMEVAASGLR